MILIPDTSFFICFLDDLDKLLPPDQCDQFLLFTTNSFEVYLLKEVQQEIQRARFPNEISENFIVPGEVPWQGPPIEVRLGAGETAVIKQAWNCYNNNMTDYKFILDDNNARTIVEEWFHEISNHMIGTVGFLEKCAEDHLYDKEAIINILSQLARPDCPFRISKKIVQASITKLKNKKGKR